MDKILRGSNILPRVNVLEGEGGISMSLGEGKYNMPETIVFSPNEQTLRVVFDGTEGFRNPTLVEASKLLKAAFETGAKFEVLRPLLNFIDQMVNES